MEFNILSRWNRTTPRLLAGDKSFAPIQINVKLNYRDGEGEAKGSIVTIRLSPEERK
jgi:hypothetical protein